MRCTVETDRPLARAIPRELQCVALSGRLSSVWVITASIRRSSTVRGVPERGSSRKPSSRSDRKRRRHLLTVTGSIPSCAATSLLCRPDAQPSTILARSAKACAVFRRFANDSSSVRSEAVTSTIASRNLLINQAQDAHGDTALSQLVRAATTTRIRKIGPADLCGGTQAGPFFVGKFSRKCPEPHRSAADVQLLRIMAATQLGPVFSPEETPRYFHRSTRSRRQIRPLECCTRSGKAPETRR